MDEVWLVLVKLYVFEDGFVTQSGVSKLKLVKRDTVHQQRELNFTKVSFGLFQSVVAIRIGSVGTSEKENV
jgi:hypothetical protein